MCSNYPKIKLEAAHQRYIRIQNWAFVIICSRPPPNCKTGHFTSWKERERLQNVGKWKMHVQSVQKHCFSLSNMQFCDALVAVVVVFKHARFWDVEGNRKRTFLVPGQWCLPHFFILIIPNGEKLLSNVNVIAWRRVSRENRSLPFVVRVSKLRLLKLRIDDSSNIGPKARVWNILVPRGCDPFGQRHGSRPLARSNFFQAAILEHQSFCAVSCFIKMVDQARNDAFHETINSGQEILNFSDITLKEKQYEVLKLLVVEKNDVLVVLPTGYGKALIY